MLSKWHKYNTLRMDQFLFFFLFKRVMLKLLSNDINIIKNHNHQLFKKFLAKICFVLHSILLLLC